MFRFRIVVFGLLVFLLGCQATLPPPPPSVTALPTVASLVIGVSDGAGLLPQVLEDFRPKLTLTLPQTNDATLLDDLDNDRADAIVIHHIPDNRPDLWSNPIALDGIALIVHPDNPLNELTLAETQALFSGKISDWTVVGGLSSVVSLTIQESDSGTRALFKRFVMADQRVSINAEIRPKPHSIITAVANNPSAIGYLSIGALPTDAAVKLLAINGIVPSPTTLGTQEYPLSMPLYWVSHSEPQGELRGVLAWLQSAEGQEQLGQFWGRVR